MRFSLFRSEKCELKRKIWKHYDDTCALFLNILYKYMWVCVYIYNKIPSINVMSLLKYLMEWLNYWFNEICYMECGAKSFTVIMYIYKWIWMILSTWCVYDFECVFMSVLYVCVSNDQFLLYSYSLDLNFSIYDEISTIPYNKLFTWKLHLLCIIINAVPDLSNALKMVWAMSIDSLTLLQWMCVFVCVCILFATYDWEQQKKVDAR